MPLTSHAIMNGNAENDTSAARAAELACAASSNSVRPAKVSLPTILRAIFCHDATCAIEWNFGTSFAQIASPGKQPTKGTPG